MSPVGVLPSLTPELKVSHFRYQALYSQLLHGHLVTYPRKTAWFPSLCWHHIDQYGKFSVCAKCLIIVSSEKDWQSLQIFGTCMSCHMSGVAWRGVAWLSGVSVAYLLLERALPIPNYPLGWQWCSLELLHTVWELHFDWHMVFNRESIIFKNSYRVQSNNPPAK